MIITMADSRRGHQLNAGDKNDGHWSFKIKKIELICF